MISGLVSHNSQYSHFAELPVDLTWERPQEVESSRRQRLPSLRTGLLLDCVCLLAVTKAYALVWTVLEARMILLARLLFIIFMVATNSSLSLYVCCDVSDQWLTTITKLSTDCGLLGIIQCSDCLVGLVIQLDQNKTM